MNKEVLYVSNDGSGHYHLVECTDYVTVYRWEGDATWTKPGEMVAKLDKHNLNLRASDIGTFTVTACYFIHKYLKNRNYFDTYSEFQLKEKK
jgi:hypothetical protein